MGRPGLSSDSDTAMLLRGRRRSRQSKRAQQSLRPFAWIGMADQSGCGPVARGQVGGAERVRETLRWTTVAGGTGL